MSTLRSVGTTQPAIYRVAIALFAVSFLTYGCFLQRPQNANVASRMFLTLSLVEDSRLSIDRWAANTKDKALVNGRYYSDKAPGLSLAAVPATALLWKKLGTTDSRQIWPSEYYLFTYVATLSTSALLTAISVAALFLVAFEVFGNFAGATLIAISYGFATPAFGWGTAFVGHAPAMGLMCIGFVCLHCLQLRRAFSALEYGIVVIAAACLTWGVVTEFTAAPVAAAIAVYSFRNLAINRESRLKIAGVALLTGVVFALPLLIYNHLAFGAPWRLGYQSVQGFPGMAQGLFGIGVPRLDVLFEIIFGPRRGIVQLAPLLLLVPVGLVLMIANNAHRALGSLIAVIIAYYLLLNSSYYYWDGGSSTGARHITGMLPFACLALGAVWNAASRGMRIFVVLLVLLSATLGLMCTSTGMFAPSSIRGLLFGYVVPGWLHGASSAVPVQLLNWRSRYFVLGLLLLWFCFALVVRWLIGSSWRSILKPNPHSPSL